MHFAQKVDRPAQEAYKKIVSSAISVRNEYPVKSVCRKPLKGLQGEDTDRQRRA